MDSILFYQPCSRMNSSFPRSGPLPSSKFQVSSLNHPSTKRPSTSGRNKPSDDIFLQLRGTDDVDSDESSDDSSDDELPSVQELVSLTTRAHQAKLKASTRPPASRNPPAGPSLNRSIQTAKSSAPTPSGATSTPRRRLFKNVPEWSLFQNPPAQASTPKNQAETNNGNSQENSIVIDDDDDDGDLTAQSNRASHQLTVDNPKLGGEDTDGDTDSAAHVSEVVANSDLDNTAMLQGDNRSAIATSTSFYPEIPEYDSATTLDEERQLIPSMQENPILSPSGKRSRSLSGSCQADGRNRDWVFDVFAEDDGGTEGDGSPPSKRARSSPPPLKTVEDRPSPVVAAKGVQMPGSTNGDRSPRGDQDYEVHQIVGESGSEYEVTAVTKIWLPKASVGLKLVRKYRAEQRAATRVRTRWSSRLQNKS